MSEDPHERSGRRNSWPDFGRAELAASSRPLDSAARLARAVGGFVLGLVARVWLTTLRVTLEVHPSLEAVADRPWILAFLHGKQWPLLAWKRRRPTVVMVSLSKDGELQTRALSVLGFSVVRGSSSRGGARALAELVRRLKRGDQDAAFAVDGPRGPYGVPKPGVLLAARAAGAVIVPMGSAIAGAKTFERAWDRFALAWPFARVSVVLGAPVEVGPRGSEDARVRPHGKTNADELGDDAKGDVGVVNLATAIHAANDAAEAILAVPRARMLRFTRF